MLWVYRHHTFLILLVQVSTLESDVYTSNSTVGPLTESVNKEIQRRNKQRICWICICFDSNYKDVPYPCALTCMHLYLKLHLVFENKCMYLYSNLKINFKLLRASLFQPKMNELTLVITDMAVTLK